MNRFRLHSEGNADFFLPADEQHQRREKARARELRRSQWWKNRLAAGRCHYCGRTFHPSELTMDHVVPIIRGGKSTRHNVVPACRECNARKKHMLPVEWNEYLDKLQKDGETPPPAPGRSPDNS